MSSEYFHRHHSCLVFFYGCFDDPKENSCKLILIDKQRGVFNFLPFSSDILDEDEPADSVCPSVSGVEIIRNIRLAYIDRKCTVYIVAL